MEFQKDMIWFVISILGGAIATLGYLLRDLYQNNQQRHKDHDKKFEIVEGVIDRKCSEVEKMLFSEQEILSIVNGKYQTRREMDLVLSERSEYRQANRERLTNMEAGINDRLNKLELEVIRLRDHFHQTRDNLQQIFNQIQKKNGG